MSRVTRRNLLRGLGCSAVALPFVSSTLGRVGQAMDGDHPLRFVFMFTGNQQIRDHWMPSGSESDFEFGSVLRSLDPIKHKVLAGYGLRGGGRGGHSGGMSETTTGRPSPVGSGDGIGVPTGGPSIDQFLASRMDRTAISSLQLGHSPGSDSSDHIVYSDSGLPILATGSAQGAFDRMFAAANGDPAEADARRADDRSVLDSITRELGVLSRRLGPESRRLLDEHLELVRRRELELANPVPVQACELGAAPGGDDPIGGQFRNIELAFRCDLTRVATLQIGGYGGDASYGAYGIDGAGHHNAAHGGGSDPAGRLFDLQEIHASRLANFLQSLDAVPEGEGTLLDNTVIVWASELGLESLPDADSDRLVGGGHSRGDLPLIVAGGANAGLSLGRFVDFGDAAYQHVLFSITQLFGHHDVERFGEDGTQMLEQLMA